MNGSQRCNFLWVPPVHLWPVLQPVLVPPDHHHNHIHHGNLLLKHHHHRRHNSDHHHRHQQFSSSCRSAARREQNNNHHYTDHQQSSSSSSSSSAATRVSAAKQEEKKQVSYFTAKLLLVVHLSFFLHLLPSSLLFPSTSIFPSPLFLPLLNPLISQSQYVLISRAGPCRHKEIKWFVFESNAPSKSQGYFLIECCRQGDGFCCKSVCPNLQKASAAWISLALAAFLNFPRSLPPHLPWHQDSRSFLSEPDADAATWTSRRCLEVKLLLMPLMPSGMQCWRGWALQAGKPVMCEGA